MAENEIEAKVLDVDRKELEQKIEDLGAEKIFEGHIESEFFDFPDGRIEEKGLLRLRKREDKTFITRKKEISYEEAKEMEEIEFDVGSREEARKFLESLGLEKVHGSQKNRVKWVKDDTEFVIDKIPKIPPMLEIEAPTKEELREVFEKIGFSIDETVNWGAKKIREKHGELEDI